MNNQVEEVKNKTDIVSLIGEYVELKKAGRNYKANCPFHGEKTPSFMVSPELQIYKCFGCGKSGDVFTFLEEHENMEFSEALRYLAEKLGIKIVSFTKDDMSEKERIYEINKVALNYYEYMLFKHNSGRKILEYLQKDRGLSLESIKLFKLGYSLESYDAFPKYLIDKKNIKPQELTKAGLLVGGGNRYFDRFRGRVIFPLFDHRDNIIGFAGRILPWVKQDMAKYINSPDTLAYHKSKVLFGLNITKNEIKKKGYVIVVEGELDMISSYQAGVKNVVAIKGSVLTEDQIRLLSRFTKKIILCLDADFAGNEAARKASITAENMGFEVKVARIVGFKDPDEIAQKNPKAFFETLKNSINIWDFLIEDSISRNNIETGEQKGKVSKEIIPLLKLIEDKIVQAHYVEVLSRKLSVSQEIIFEEIEKKNTESGFQPPNNRVLNNPFSTFSQAKSRRDMLEEKLLVAILENDPKSFLTTENIELFQNPFLKKIISLIVKENFDNFNLTLFSKSLPKELQQKFSEMILDNSEKEDIGSLLKELKNILLKDRLLEIEKKIKQSKSESESEELLTEFKSVSQKLSAL